MVVTRVSCNNSNLSNQELVTNLPIHFTHAQFSPYSTCNKVALWQTHQMLEWKKTILKYETNFFYFVYFCNGTFCFIVKLIKIKLHLLCLCRYFSCKLLVLCLLAELVHGYDSSCNNNETLQPNTLLHTSHTFNLNFIMANTVTDKWPYTNTSVQFQFIIANRLLWQ